MTFKSGFIKEKVAVQSAKKGLLSERFRIHLTIIVVDNYR